MSTIRVPRSRLPFQNLQARGWVNLAIAGLFLFYAAQVVLDLAWGNLFGNLGIDFASFWSAGYIANQYGYAAVYDVDLMGEVQRRLLPMRAGSVQGLGVIPTPYLPVFLLPFQLLALLPPAVAAGGWILLNLIGSVLYLRHFAERLTGHPLERRLLFMLLASAPIFLNLFAGQVNVWLMICAGEFILAQSASRGFRAGLWLAGLLLKPQILVLILAGVLLQRWTKTALGVLVGALIVVGSSWMLADTDALTSLTRLWLGYAGGLPTNDPQLMMNWRMIGSHLETLIGPAPALILALLGSVVTACVALAGWARPVAEPPSRLFVASLGMLAAAVVVAWHAHVHMAVVLIPALLAVALEQRKLLGGLLEWWILFPAALYLLRIVLASIMHANVLMGSAYSLLDLLAGIGAFSMNLVLVGWAAGQLASRRS